LSDVAAVKGLVDTAEGGEILVPVAPAE